MAIAARRRSPQSLDNLFAFAALTDAVVSEQFDLMFDATLGDDAVRAFLVDANPAGRAPHGGRVRGGGAPRLLASRGAIRART